MPKLHELFMRLKWKRSDLIMLWGGIFPRIKWKISSFVYWAVLRIGYRGLSTEPYAEKRKRNKYKTGESSHIHMEAQARVTPIATHANPNKLAAPNY